MWAQSLPNRGRGGEPPAWRHGQTRGASGRHERQVALILRFGVWRLQIKRFGRRPTRIGEEPKPGDIADVGRAGFADDFRREPCGPGFDCQHRRAGARHANRPGAEEPHGLAYTGNARRHQRPTIRPEDGEIDAAMFCIDSRDDEARLARKNQWRRQGRKGRNPRRRARGRRCRSPAQRRCRRAGR